MSPQSQQTAFAQALRDANQMPTLLALLAGDADRNRRRIALYRGNVIAHASRALQAAYPVIEQVVGQLFFAGLCRAFWLATPPVSGDWHDYGEPMAEFLNQFAPAAHLAYLPDLARLEWLVHQASFADQAAATNPETDAATALLQQPGTAVLAADYPVASIWLAHQTNSATDLATIDWQPQGALVFRNRFQVEIAALPYDQAHVLGEIISPQEQS